jgi:hypothetical protein
MAGLWALSRLKPGVKNIKINITQTVLFMRMSNRGIKLKNNFSSFTLEEWIKKNIRRLFYY